MSQSRAPKGGAVGTNGEFYEGGKFLPSTKLPKRSAPAKKRGTGRCQYEPYKWTVPPVEGWRPIYGEFGTTLIMRDGVAVPHDSDRALAYCGVTREHAQRIADQWNAGMRWMDDHVGAATEFRPHTT